MSMIQCMAAAQVVSEMQKLQTLQESVMKVALSQAVSEMQKLQNLQESAMKVALSQFNFFITVMQPTNLNKKESDEIITKEVGSSD